GTPAPSPLRPYTTRFRSLQLGAAWAHALPGAEVTPVVHDAEGHCLPQVVGAVPRLLGDRVLVEPSRLSHDRLLPPRVAPGDGERSEEHTSELQSRERLVC